MASRDLFGHTPKVHEFTSKASMGEALTELAAFVLEEEAAVLAITTCFFDDESDLLTGTWAAHLIYDVAL